MYDITPGLGFDPTFGTLDQAASYIEGKIAAFRALGPKLATEMHQLSHIAAAANAQGDAAAADQAKAELATVSELYRDWGSVADKLDMVTSAVSGLGQAVAIATVLGGAAAVVALAVAMYGIFRRESAAEKALDALAKGTLTPQEAAQFAKDRGSGGVFGSLSGIAKAAAVVAVVLLAYPVVTNLDLGKRSWD